MMPLVKVRLGHERSYSMDISFIRERLDWSPRHSFDQQLRETVEWHWFQRSSWERVQSKDYPTSSAEYLQGIGSTTTSVG